MQSIAEIRKALGLTQAELADRLGVHQSTISRCENAEEVTDRRTLLAAQALLIGSQDAAA